MNQPHDKASDPLEAYEQLLEQRRIPPKSRPYFLRWARMWLATVNRETAPATTEDFFHEQGRRPKLQAWQFQQGVRAVAWLARDILRIPWAQAFDWRGLADAAEPLEGDHRTIGRETIPVSSANTVSPVAPSQGPLPETRAEVCRITEELRRAIRACALSRKNHADDLAAGCGEVHMPEALLRKYPSASREWAWQTQ